jgi:hypothetical protein
LLTIIDKLAIAAVLVIVGLFANLLLERYRTKRALAVEIAKKRVELIGDLWQRFSTYELAWYRASYAVAEGYYHEFKGSSQDTLPKPLLEALSVLEEVAGELLPEGASDRIKAHTKATHDVLVEEKDAMFTFSIKNRLLIGERHLTAFNRFVNEYEDAFGGLSYRTSDCLRFVQQVRQLDRRRPDIAALVSTLL